MNRSENELCPQSVFFQRIVLFKVVPLSFLLLSPALYLPQILLNRPLCISKLTGFLVCLMKFAYAVFSERLPDFFLPKYSIAAAYASVMTAAML